MLALAHTESGIIYLQLQVKGREITTIIKI